MIANSWYFGGGSGGGDVVGDVSVSVYVHACVCPISVVNLVVWPNNIY